MWRENNFLKYLVDFQKKNSASLALLQNIWENLKN